MSRHQIGYCTIGGARGPRSGPSRSSRKDRRESPLTHDARSFMPLIFKRRSCQELWKPAPGLLEARECVYVRNIERGDVLAADNLHHSRRRVRRAGHKHGNLAIVECVGKEPKLPSIAYAHWD